MGLFHTTSGILPQPDSVKGTRTVIMMPTEAVFRADFTASCLRGALPVDDDSTTRRRGNK
jgi:hypothetical protein